MVFMYKGEPWKFSHKNVEPIVEHLLALGFVEDNPTSPLTRYFSRSMNGIEYWIQVHQESGCWDISEETIVLHAIGERPANLAQARGSYGTSRIPSLDEIRGEITTFMAEHKKRIDDRARETAKALYALLEEQRRFAHLDW